MLRSRRKLDVCPLAAAERSGNIYSHVRENVLGSVCAIRVLDNTQGTWWWEGRIETLETVQVGQD